MLCVPGCMSVLQVCVQELPPEVRRHQDPLELELQVIVSNHVVLGVQP